MFFLNFIQSTANSAITYIEAKRNERNNQLKEAAIQEVALQKLAIELPGHSNITEGIPFSQMLYIPCITIRAPYGIYDEKGKQADATDPYLVRPLTTKGDADNVLVETCTISYLPTTQKVVDYLKKQAELGKINCINDLKYFCEPLIKAEREWKTQELRNGTIGFFDHPKFQPRYKFSELSPRLQAEVPYFTQAMKVGLGFTGLYNKMQPKNPSTLPLDLTKLYKGPSEPENSQVQPEGAIGIADSGWTGSILLTKWGTFYLANTNFNDEEFERKADSFFEFSEMAGRIGWPGSDCYFGPCYSITKDMDGKELPLIQRVPNETYYKSYRKEKEIMHDWEQIKDVVFHELHKDGTMKRLLTQLSIPEDRKGLRPASDSFILTAYSKK